VRGGKQVLESCRQELGIDVGGTTADGLFTLEVARCFGACGLAPTMMIDDDVHQRVKPQKLRAIFSGYRESISQKAKTATRATPKSKPRPRASLKANPKKKPVKMHVRGRKERVAAQ
jgi:(2Fe-2S) ferredoxin